MFGSINKAFMKSLTGASRVVCETNAANRYVLIQSESPENLQCKPGSVEGNQLSMAARDREKREHVLNRCWDFFVNWC